MDREQATEALALLKRVVSQARDDTTLQNWGLLWVIHGITNGSAFIATNLMLRAGWATPAPFALLWTATIGLNFVTIFALKSGSSGVRSFVENQIWVIWTSFIVASAMVCLLNYRLGLDELFAGIVMAILAAFAFAMMGGVMGRRWFAWSAACAAAAVVMAFVPAWQFAILGVLWGVIQSGGGVMLIVEKRRRLASGAPHPTLV